MIKQNISSRLATEFSPAPERAEVLALLDPIFPQPELHPGGFYFFKPEEIRSFNALFERFGLEFRASDEKFENIGYLTDLWYRLVNGFGSLIECSVYSPVLFEFKLRKWPEKFKAYLQAVMSNDQAGAFALAVELRVADLASPMPPAMFE
jgi:hypothetical protein